MQQLLKSSQAYQEGTKQSWTTKTLVQNDAQYVYQHGSR